MKDKKAKLRKKAFQSIQSLDDIKRDQLSKKLQKGLINYLTKSNLIHKHIGIYYPLDGEVDPIFDHKRSFYFPKIKAKCDMNFYPSSIADLKKVSAFSREFLEPLEVGDRDQVEVIIVPGLAFSKSGKRLGRGKGFYDRYLMREESRDIYKIGVCFDEQIIEEELMITESHDVQMNVVITPSRIFEE